MPWPNQPAPDVLGPRPRFLVLGAAAPLWLGGCAEAGGPIGALAFVAVALGGLAAGLAYALGRRVGTAAAAAPAMPSSGPSSTDLLPELLDALPGPALMLQAAPTGWRLRHANAAARQAWPSLPAAADPAPAAGSWPPGLLDSLSPGGHPAVWRSCPVPGSPGSPGSPGLTLAWQPASAPAPTLARADDPESFTFTLSHDLKAPLRVVDGFTRIVKEDYGAQLDRVGNDHLDRVLGAAARMSLMIDAMLNLAELSSQPLQRQPVNLSQLAGYVADDLRRGTPERAVEIEIEPGLVVGGDPTLLRLVLENLLGNAWKYTGKAASPRIELRREPPSGSAAFGFVVRDNGAGFDMRSADRLFGLFQRLHSASDFPGHGVGLASVRRIVERHGGRIWAESEPGRGAAFHVELAP